VLDGPQVIVEPAVHSAFSIVRLAAADRDGEHRATPAENAFTETIAPSFATLNTDSIGEAVSEDSVDPALQYGGHAIPPYRKTRQNGVRPQQLALLGFDFRGLGAGSESECTAVENLFRIAGLHEVDTRSQRQRGGEGTPLSS
jgi:hypothetical protein